MALIEGIAALLAKVASVSTVAQATAGLGIAVAGVTGAGAAGVLPAPLQDTVAGAVEAVTPFEMPHATDGSDVRHTPADAERPEAVPTVLPTPAVLTPSPAAPTTEAGEDETEHGAETADGTHQHRGGRTAAAVATVESADDSPEAPETPEVGDDHGGEDSSGHGGDDSGGGSGGSGHDNGSGHGDD
jgi:hypothetical protein